MIIDFNQIPEEHIEGFKGGKGTLLTRNYVDGQARIMRSSLQPGACSGEHAHAENFEVIYVLSGALTFHYDGEEEVALPGQAHYCPKGHKHWFENCGDVPAEYLAIVPTKVL